MTEPTGAQLSVATSIQQSSEGHWVALHLNFPLGAFVIAMPPDSADQLAAQLPDMLRDTAQQARRLNTGLVVADATALTTLKGRNNHGHSKK